MNEMMRAETVERKTRGANTAMENIPELVERLRIRKKPTNVVSCYQLLANDHLVIGFFDYFVRREIVALKNNLFVACRLKMAAMKMNDYQRFETGGELLFALLSDSSEVIKEMAEFEGQHFRSARNNPLYPQFRGHMWQLAIRGEFTELEKKIEHVAKNGRKQDRQAAARKEDFFSLLIDGDKQRLTELIAAHAGQKRNEPITEDYFAFWATLETKICWYHGIEVDIQNEGVPMALMPVRPLENYEQPYDFLEPGWQPPVTGWKGKLTQWFGRG